MPTLYDDPCAHDHHGRWRWSSSWCQPPGIRITWHICAQGTKMHAWLRYRSVWRASKSVTRLVARES